MTGRTIVGSDVKTAGIATHFVRSAVLPDLVEALRKTPHTSYFDYDQALKVFEDASPHNAEGWQSVITPNMATIERCFSNKTSVANIVKALEAEKDDAFAKETLQTLNTVSPLAVHIAHELVKRGRSLSLPECLQMEYNVVQRALVRFCSRWTIISLPLCFLEILCMKRPYYTCIRTFYR